MPIPANPPFLTNVLCYGGDVLTIPATTPTGTGQFSYQAGWPAVTSLPLSAGGIAPDRKYFNAAFKLLSQHVFFQQSGCVYPWNNGRDYLVNSHVVGTDGKEYVALKASGPSSTIKATNPVGDTTKTWTTLTSATGAGGGVPLGTIVAFSGTFGGTGSRFPIPLGDTTPDTTWCLCDGTTTNSLAVPDLRGRMIIGVNTTYKVGATGGAATHTHKLSGSAGNTTLTVAQLAEHSHIQSTQGALSGTVKVPQQGWKTYYDEKPEYPYITHSTGENATHTHTLTSGSAAAANGMPPYYALSFIMKCA